MFIPAGSWSSLLFNDQTSAAAALQSSVGAADSLTPSPPDDGWSAARKRSPLSGRIIPRSRSRQARFLSNCIGFSNFLFWDEWIEILVVLLIVCGPAVIITYDPFSILGWFDACWWLISVLCSDFTFLRNLHKTWKRCLLLYLYEWNSVKHEWNRWCPNRWLWKPTQPLPQV